jgi:tRNA(fMet)-specific endonuclease VapC
MGESEIFDTSLALERKEGNITLFSVIEHPPFRNKQFHVFFPEGIDYIKGIEIAEKLRAKGKPIGAIDILIAAMCINRSVKLLSKDNHFSFIGELFPEFKFQILK